MIRGALIIAAHTISSTASPSSATTSTNGITTTRVGEGTLAKYKRRPRAGRMHHLDDRRLHEPQSPSAHPTVGRSPQEAPGHES
ncbi:hypothetical protein K523DRAFT_138038 [Schizophyllum commune Tattone D]|nr:hypothetical protein K523DRAFT_138038 [Schizophyllum commune Tattone D]